MRSGCRLRQPIQLRQVLSDAEWVGAGDLAVTSCTADSRQVQPGDLFVALAGTADDGHRYVAEAVRRGAIGLVVQRPIGRLGVPVCRVPDTRRAFGCICQALAGHPSRQIKVIGVTGTNGKTTTSLLIASVLRSAGFQVALTGTLGSFDGREFAEAQWTTPPADRLAEWLARAVSHGCSHAVIEVSSHGLDQSRIAGIQLDAACLTNVREDHLDYHGSLAAYWRAKCRIFEHLTPEGFAVLNADDAFCRATVERLATPALTVGLRSAAEISASVMEEGISEQMFLLSAGCEHIPVRTRMIGKHHVYNSLMAAAVGLAYGIELVAVVRGLEALDRVPGRLERIECGQPFGVFVDYAHTADALAAALGTLRRATSGRLICVFGAGGRRDRRKRPRMGRVVETHADVAVITNDNPREEPPEVILAEILAGFRHPESARVIPDRAQAIGWALSEAQPGDCVLIAGKGHEKYQIVGRRRLPFDDRHVAKTWLYEHPPLPLAATN